jgi:hypothetical protein
MRTRLRLELLSTRILQTHHNKKLQNFPYKARQICNLREKERQLQAPEIQVRNQFSSSYDLTQQISAEYYYYVQTNMEKNLHTTS